MRRHDDGWVVEASAGDPAITDAGDGERYDLRDGHVLVMTGPPLPADAHRLVATLLSYLEAVIAMHRLEVEATAAGDLSRTNDLRNALLAAVSHDLRTPLASIKAQASGWLEPDVDVVVRRHARVHGRRSTPRPTGSTPSSRTCST